MPDKLAEFLDDITLHIEREMAKVPPPVAEALSRIDLGLTTVDVLRILARPEQAANLLEREVNSRAPFAEPAVVDTPRPAELAPAIEEETAVFI